jgi:DNA-binding MarR family transcriptional regulator
LVASFVRDLADLQLKPVGFSLLCLVGHNPGITSRQLCQTLDIQPPNLVGLVSALTDRGCLQRLAHPTDGRAWGLHLTALGESLLAQAETRILASERQACAGLSGAEQATLKQLLQKIYLA